MASVAFTTGEGDVYLIDATPDIQRQVAMVRDWQDPTRRQAARTRRPVDGIFLTHGHMGHYAGLLELGFEAAHADAVPVYGTESMEALLEEHAPWSQLVALKEIELRTVTPGAPVTVGPVKVVPVSVPHRAEFTDTVGYRLEGPRQAALYLPDVARWEEIPDPDALLAGVDVLLLDATFFSGEELPGRDLTRIGHPLVVDSLARLGPRVEAGLLRVVLVHLNHSNPLLDEGSEAALRVRQAGFEVARRGLELRL